MTATPAAVATRLLRRQFDFTPPEVARAWLPRLEQILLDLELAQSYPVDWLLFRVSGVAPAATNDDVVARGADLVPTLVELVEEQHRRLGPHEFDPRTDLDAEEVAAGFGVSRRTLQRWRLDGLPMLRLRREDGRDRSGLRRAAVDRFRDLRPERVAGAAAYHRMDGRERGRIVAEFEAVRSRGLSTTAAIDQVASTSGRSSNTVRAVVCGPPSPVRREGDADRRRRFLLRSLERGVAVESIAQRIGRSVDVVRRSDLDRRRRRILEAIPDSEPVVVANAARPEAAEVFAVAGVIDGLARDLAGATFGDWLRRVRTLPDVEDDETTRSRIAAMHYALGRARETFSAIQGIKRPGDRRLDPVESDLRWWGLLVERSVIRGCGEGLRRFEQVVGRRIEQLPAARVPPALSLVLESVSHVVVGFDPARRVSGHSLDRAVALGVGRRLARESDWGPVVGAVSRGRLSEPVPVDTLAICNSAVRSLLGVERWWRRCSPSERESVVDGNGGEAFLIRFGLEPKGRPRTLLDTGRRLGVAPTRIIGSIDDAMRRLRRTALLD